MDATPRRKGVFIMLTLQNLFVALNATCLLLIILFKTTSGQVWEVLQYVLITLLIIFGALARLYSVGTDIAVERDWVV
ncbi:hypothetical protein, partial [Salmonella sp. s51228]|uniref:hypothetical protein n=1 Tax=Salmonella sp. s51228 TaxID=3159652 RepID=UPI00397EF89F